MSKIKLTDTFQDMIFKMSEGSPGALTCLMSLVRDEPIIDPDSAMPLGAILHLDTLEIYGTDIYVLWSDICERNNTKMLAVLRAIQLGLLDENTVKDAASRQDYSGKALLNTEEIYNSVKKELPNFGGIQE